MQRRHSTEFKVRVVLKASRERKTLAELASEHGVHAVQISQWKKQALHCLLEVFSAGRDLGGEREGCASGRIVPRGIWRDRHGIRAKEKDAHQDELYRENGRLKVGLDWLKRIRSWG